MNWPAFILELVPFGALVFCGGLLVYYRRKKRFPKDRIKSKLAFIEANIVEIIIALMFIALAAPDWAALIIP